jgi:hypothetical protein
MKIWIVHGSAGEYSDRGEWLVEAHKTEDAAKARVAALDALLLEHGYKHGDGPNDGDWKARMARREAFAKLARDPRFSSDYTGTTYWVAECELIDA